MLEIIRGNGSEYVSLGHVSEQTGISRRYLDQVAASLKQAGLLSGRAGKGGGYKLARPPTEIRLDQIIEATVGRLNIVDCVRSPETCMKSDGCDCRPLYVLINERILGVLEEITLEEMASQSWQGNLDI